MSWLYAALALLFLVNIGLTLAVLALARQVGVLFERIAPMGALSLKGGLRVGEKPPVIRAPLLSGGAVSIGAPSPRSRLIFFLSPTCPVCKKLLPALKNLATAESDRVEIFLASDGELSEHTSFAQKAGLTLPYLLSAELGLAFQIGKLPYAVLLSPDATLRAKGLVNTREQLESLLEAEERGVGSLQDFAARQRKTQHV
jgi:methylamine dehydrogenase accessory protein MauD